MYNKIKNFLDVQVIKAQTNLFMIILLISDAFKVVNSMFC